MRDTVEDIIGDIKLLLDQIGEKKYPSRTKSLTTFRLMLKEYLKDGEKINEERAKLFAKVRSENGKRFSGPRIVLSPTKFY